MTQQDKELLLKDLCARLPYGIKAQYCGEEEETLCIDTIDCVDVTSGKVEITIGQYGLSIDKVKPCLRPMSSMTNQERAYFGWMLDNLNEDYNSYDVTDWLNAHHFDYRGLIDKGLAIEVTEKNNSYKYV